jgi:hypothetical protein
MKRIFLIASVTLAGCSETTKTPEIKDIEKISIDGKPYTAIQYVREFCQFPETEKDMNCFNASKQASKDMSKFRNVKPSW